jgi:hypothetical protein
MSDSAGPRARRASLVTSDPRAWLAELTAGPLLLHVDFDYFCNRFNGDSDWHEHPQANDVGEEEVERRVDTLVAALAEADVAGAVQSVCGALSPKPRRRRRRRRQRVALTAPSGGSAPRRATAVRRGGSPGRGGRRASTRRTTGRTGRG